jgi:hypothetical protein
MLRLLRQNAAWGKTFLPGSNPAGTADSVDKLAVPLQETNTIDTDHTDMAHSCVYRQPVCHT